MSASNKKKLRSQQKAEQMTERQLQEQKEAKKLKIYTVAFVVTLAVMVLIAAVIGGSNIINNSGILQRNTTAYTVGSHDINSVQFNYFYMDEVNNFCSENQSYLSLLGLNTTLPLDEQPYYGGGTWADYFLSTAKSTVKATYALYDAAVADNYVLTEDDKTNIDATISNMTFYAMYYYNLSDLGSYLTGAYGIGANEESYREYLELTALAASYYNNHVSSLEYTDADLEAALNEAPNNYTSYTYNSYNLRPSDFLTGDADADLAAAEKAAEEAAKSLAVPVNSTVERLDLAISALEINADAETPVTSNSNKDVFYTSVTNEDLKAWLSDSSRKEGDITYVTNTTTSTDENGVETETVTSYTVVLFHSASDNNFPLVNVRHVLVTEGGTYNSTTGLYDYTDDMAAAKAKAEELLKQWQEGDATEDTFAELAKENSSDGNAAQGGIYEDILPGYMVETFNDWCFDESRKPGDTGLVQTDYGWHIMYFVGNSDTTYRDYMITGNLRSADTESWYTGLVDAVTVTDGSTKYVPMGVVLSNT